MPIPSQLAVICQVQRLFAFEKAVADEHAHFGLCVAVGWNGDKETLAAYLAGAQDDEELKKRWNLLRPWKWSVHDAAVRLGSKTRVIEAGLQPLPSGRSVSEVDRVRDAVDAFVGKRTKQLSDLQAFEWRPVPNEDNARTRFSYSEFLGVAMTWPAELTREVLQLAYYFKVPLEQLGEESQWFAAPAFDVDIGGGETLRLEPKARPGRRKHPSGQEFTFWSYAAESEDDTEASELEVPEVPTEAGAYGDWCAQKDAFSADELVDVERLLLRKIGKYQPGPDEANGITAEDWQERLVPRAAALFDVPMRLLEWAADPRSTPLAPHDRRALIQSVVASTRDFVGAGIAVWGPLDGNTTAERSLLVSVLREVLKLDGSETGLPADARTFVTAVVAWAVDDKNHSYDAWLGALENEPRTRSAAKRLRDFDTALDPDNPNAVKPSLSTVLPVLRELVESTSEDAAARSLLRAQWGKAVESSAAAVKTFWLRNRSDIAAVLEHRGVRARQSLGLFSEPWKAVLDSSHGGEPAKLAAAVSRQLRTHLVDRLDSGSRHLPEVPAPLNGGLLAEVLTHFLPAVEDLLFPVETQTALPPAGGAPHDLAFQVAPADVFKEELGSSTLDRWVSGYGAVLRATSKKRTSDWRNLSLANVAIVDGTKDSYEQLLKTGEHPTAVVAQRRLGFRDGNMRQGTLVFDGRPLSAKPPRTANRQLPDKPATPTAARDPLLEMRAIRRRRPTDVPPKGSRIPALAFGLYYELVPFARDNFGALPPEVCLQKSGKPADPCVLGFEPRFDEAEVDQWRRQARYLRAVSVGPPRIDDRGKTWHLNDVKWHARDDERKTPTALTRAKRCVPLAFEIDTPAELVGLGSEHPTEYFFVDSNWSPQSGEPSDDQRELDLRGAWSLTVDRLLGEKHRGELFIRVRGNESVQVKVEFLETKIVLTPSVNGNAGQPRDLNEREDVGFRLELGPPDGPASSPASFVWTLATRQNATRWSEPERLALDVPQRALGPTYVEATSSIDALNFGTPRIDDLGAPKSADREKATQLCILEPDEDKHGYRFVVRCPATQFQVLERWFARDEFDADEPRWDPVNEPVQVGRHHHWWRERRTRVKNASDSFPASTNGETKGESGVVDRWLYSFEDPAVVETLGDANNATERACLGVELVPVRVGGAATTERALVRLPAYEPEGDFALGVDLPPESWQALKVQVRYRLTSIGERLDYDPSSRVLTVSVLRGEIWELRHYSAVPAAHFDEAAGTDAPSGRMDSRLAEGLPRIVDGNDTFVLFEPQRLTIEVADDTEFDAKKVYERLKPSFDGDKLSVVWEHERPEHDGLDWQELVSRVEVGRVLLQWRGRPVTRFPFGASTDTLPPSDIDPADAAALSGRFPYLWEAQLTAVRDLEGRVTELKKSSIRQDTTVMEIDLQHQRDARYYLFDGLAHSRYAGLFGLKPTRGSVEVGEQVVSRRRSLVPCRHAGPVPRPMVQLVMPLMREMDPQTEKTRAPGLLVAINEPWARIGGWAESLDVAVQTTVAYDDNLDPIPGERPAFLAPDPIVNKGVFHNGHFEMRTRGPIGHTFDGNTEQAAFPATSFFVRRPEVRGPHGMPMAALKFRRVLLPEAMLGYRRGQTTEVQPGETVDWQLERPQGSTGRPGDRAFTVEAARGIDPGEPCVLEFRALCMQKIPAPQLVLESTATWRAGTSGSPVWTLSLGQDTPDSIIEGDGAPVYAKAGHGAPLSPRLDIRFLVTKVSEDREQSEATWELAQLARDASDGWVRLGAVEFVLDLDTEPRVRLFASVGGHQPVVFDAPVFNAARVSAFTSPMFCQFAPPSHRVPTIEGGDLQPDMSTFRVVEKAGKLSIADEQGNPTLALVSPLDAAGEGDEYQGWSNYVVVTRQIYDANNHRSHEAFVGLYRPKTTGRSELVSVGQPSRVKGVTRLRARILVVQSAPRANVTPDPSTSTNESGVALGSLLFGEGNGELGASREDAGSRILAIYPPTGIDEQGAG